MVRRILSILTNPTKGIYDAAFLLAVFAFASQILALVRDRLFAHFFGASSTLDIYYAAFRIPDLIFVALASMVSLFVLIPFLTQHIEQKKDGKNFLSTVFSGFFIATIFVSAVVFFLIPSLVRILFPGLIAAGYGPELILLTRILLLSPIILGISNLFASVTQVRKRFFIYALTPVVYNVGIIIGIVVLFPFFGIKGLVFGVLLGALFHAGIQLPTVLQTRLLPRLTFRPDWLVLRRVVAVSLPRTGALFANQLALLVLVGFASTLGEGAISIFNFSLNLQGVPLAIIGASYSVAAFPTLAQLFSQGDKQAFVEKIVSALRHIIFWSLPALALFIVLRAQIVRVILGSGAFDWADTRLAAASMALFVVSLLAQGVVLLFIRGYYAAGKTAKPLFVNIVSALLIIGFAYVGGKLFAESQKFQYFLESLLRVSDVAGTSVLILPLAYTLGFLINAGIFWVLFARDFGKEKLSRVYTTFLHSFSAAVLAGGGSWVALNLLDNFVDINTFVGIFTQGFVAGVVGIGIGIIVLKLLRSEELTEIWNTLHRRFWKAKTVGVEQEEL